MFRLSRHFSVTSLIGIALVVVALSFFYRALAFRVLMNHQLGANEALTVAFANSVWPRFGDFIAGAGALPAAALRARPETAALHREVLAKMRGLEVVKVKIYDLEGRTVFSTDPAQIGQHSLANPGFQSARGGRVVGEITFRDSVDTFEGVAVNRSLVSSYIPIRAGAGGAVQAVFEVYADVTDFVADLERTQWHIVAGVVGCLALLYGFLFLIVRRADRILRAQERECLANEARIRHQAYHDPLTGLPNRARFAERLDESLRLARRTERRLGLMFLDLDRFKWVNDSLGHDAGDRLLKVVTERFGLCIRESDTLFRMGGDEFTVLLGDLGQAEDAAQVARRIIEAMGAPVRLGGQEVSAGVSVGIAVFPDDG